MAGKLKLLRFHRASDVMSLAVRFNARKMRKQMLVASATIEYIAAYQSSLTRRINGLRRALKRTAKLKPPLTE